MKSCWECHRPRWECHGWRIASGLSVNYGDEPAAIPSGIFPHAGLNFCYTSNVLAAGPQASPPGQRHNPGTDLACQRPPNRDILFHPRMTYNLRNCKLATSCKPEKFEESRVGKYASVWARSFFLVRISSRLSQVPKLGLD